MTYSFSSLFSILLVFVIVNPLQAESEGGAGAGAGSGAGAGAAVCSLANHFRGREWNFAVSKDIYGNDTVEKSLAWTWNDSSDSIEAKINQQINAELFAHYTYLSMAAHFDRDDINLPGFANFFKESAEEEHKHAQMFMKYLNRRGGRVKLNSIMKPCKDQWGNGRMAMMEALEEEKYINQLLIDLHGEAERIKDYQMTDFIESNFLGEQIESIKKLANYVNTLNRIGDGLGEYQFDKITLSK